MVKAIILVIVWLSIVNIFTLIFSGLMLPLMSSTAMSIGRYILVLFPIYIPIASSKSLLLKQAWVLISILLFGMYITLFVNNYWAG